MKAYSFEEFLNEEKAWPNASSNAAQILQVLTRFKYPVPDATIALNTKSPNCMADISRTETLKLLLKKGLISREKGDGGLSRKRKVWLYQLTLPGKKIAYTLLLKMPYDTESIEKNWPKIEDAIKERIPNEDMQDFFDSRLTAKEYFDKKKGKYISQELGIV
jgi:hypothetical protein